MLQKIKYKLKMFRNLRYINKNAKSVLNKLRVKSKHSKLNVVFYIYDASKWKCETLYDAFNRDENFETTILVTKPAVFNSSNPSYQSVDDVKKTYEYFKSDSKYNVKLAYDIEKEQFIPFEKFSPDIIIYQHPWYVETSQGPVVCSKFALTYYVPYFVANAGLKEDYYLRFHQYVHKHYLLNQSLVDYFAPKMENKGKNLVAVGHPQLDYFYFNKSQNNDKNYVIYAPHWTLLGKGLAYGTFEWNGKFILDFAKSHPEINWVFKPHPLLKKALVDTQFMSLEEVNSYYDEWSQLGFVCEDSDYLNLFMNSYAMITDCGSFLTEYFLTKKPLIRIRSEKLPIFCPHCNEITKNYYEVNNIEELKKTLVEVIINKNDSMKKIREAAVVNSELSNTSAAENILNDIKKEVL